MAIVQTTYLYELLVRLGPEGFRGAHQITMERVADGETVYAEKEMPAQPVAAADVAALIGSENAALFAAITERDAQIAQLTGDLAAQADLADARAQTITEQAAAIADLQAQLAALSLPAPEAA